MLESLESAFYFLDWSLQTSIFPRITYINPEFIRVPSWQERYKPSESTSLFKFWKVISEGDGRFKKTTSIRANHSKHRWVPMILYSALTSQSQRHICVSFPPSELHTGVCFFVFRSPEHVHFTDDVKEDLWFWKMVWLIFGVMHQKYHIMAEY